MSQRQFIHACIASGSERLKHKWIIGAVLVALVISGIGWWGYQAIGELGKCQGALQEEESLNASTVTVTTVVTTTVVAYKMQTLFIFLSKGCYSPHEIVRGVVVLSDTTHNAQPFAGASIVLGAYGSDMIFGSTKSDANGEFNITLPQGPYYSAPVYFIHAYWGDAYWGERAFTITDSCGA